MLSIWSGAQHAVSLEALAFLEGATDARGAFPARRQAARAAAAAPDRRGGRRREACEAAEAHASRRCGALVNLLYLCPGFLASRSSRILKP